MTFQLLSRRVLLLLVILCSCFAHLSAQAKPASPPDIYSKETSVIERLERRYTYAADGTGSREITGVVDVRTDAAVKGWSILELTFASSAEHVEYDYVRVRHSDGTVSTTPASDAQENPAPVTREAPFYSDLKVKQIPVRGLHAGDHLEYKERIVRTKPEAPGHFWGAESFFTLASGVVILSETVELHIPKDAYIQTWSPKYAPVISDAGNERIFHWESKQVKPVAGRKKEDLLREDPIAMDMDSNGDRLPAVGWSNFRTWAEVGAWYRGMEGSRMDPDDDVRARTKEITAGKNPPEEAARAVYGFVGPQIRYIGVAFGIGRYQPHEAGDVLRNQYGDCKDKHTLQAAMLSAAGVQSDAVLIGAGIAFNEALPSPGAFNHLITLAHVNGQAVWLDATAEVAPYRLLLPVLRGKRALVVPATGEAHLETTPASAPFPFEERFTATGTLDDKGTSHSQITMELHSDSEIIFRQAVRSVTPAQWDELMQQISYQMSYAGKVTNVQFSRADDLSVPFRATYDYEREKGGDWENLRILPQLPPIGLSDTDEKDPPVLPINLGSPQVLLAHTVMKLPAGWGVELPAPIHAKSAFATLDKTYKFENGALITDRRIELLKPRIPASDWREYHAWFKAAGLDGETYVQLTRTGGKRNATAYNGEAAALISEANRLEQEKSFDAAKSKLDEANALNPHQAFLWSNYGFLAQQYGKVNEATEDFKREIKDHPEEDIPYRLLAMTQMQQRKQDDAQSTLRQLLKLHPDDEYGNRVLSGMLIAHNDYAGAIEQLRTAVAASPKNDQLKLQLGNALLHEGKNDEAQKLLTSLASDSIDPGVLNDAAYALADHSMQLPVAETAARHSLTLLEDAILAQSGSAHDALQRANLLAALWDTIGWILFREDKVRDAEPYVRAAWFTDQTAEEGLHYGQILEKMGKQSEAAATYAAAREARGGSSLEVRKALTAKADEHTAFSGHASETHSLQASRTFTVPRPASLAPAWSTVSFELSSSGTIENVVILKGNDSSGEGSGNTSQLEKVVPAITKLKLNYSLPPGSRAPLLRHALLSCNSGPTCDFVLVTPRDALMD